MRLLKLFCDSSIGPFCLVEYVIEADGAAVFAWRVFLMLALMLPMFVVVAPLWLLWQMFT